MCALEWVSIIESQFIIIYLYFYIWIFSNSNRRPSFYFVILHLLYLKKITISRTFIKSGTILTTLHFLRNLWIGSIRICTLQSLSSLVECKALAYWAHLQVTNKLKCSEYNTWGHIQNNSFSLWLNKRECLSLTSLSSPVKCNTLCYCQHVYDSK